MRSEQEQKKYTHFKESERMKLSAYLQAGAAPKAIADFLKKSVSAVYREIARLCNTIGGYDPVASQKEADKKSSLSRIHSKRDPEMVQRILSLIREKHSPTHIHYLLKRECLASVSIPTIYKIVEEDKEAGGDAWSFLMFAQKRRKAQGKSARRKEIIPDRIDMCERSEMANEREEEGHWEADLIVSPQGTKACIITLIERVTRFSIAIPCSSKQAKVVKNKICKALEPYKDRVNSITFDNGLEFFHHKKIARKLNCFTYFCKPYHSWEKGAVEQLNWMIRRWFPKKTALGYAGSQKVLADVIIKINKMYRRKLGGFSAEELFLGTKKIAL